MWPLKYCNIQEIRDENGRLRKVLAEKDYEISYLKKKIDEENAALGMCFLLLFKLKVIQIANIYCLVHCLKQRRIWCRQGGH